MGAEPALERRDDAFVRVGEPVGGIIAVVNRDSDSGESLCYGGFARAYSTCEADLNHVSMLFFFEDELRVRR